MQWAMSDIAANLVLHWKVARRSIRKKEKKTRKQCKTRHPCRCHRDLRLVQEPGKEEIGWTRFPAWLELSSLIRRVWPCHVSPPAAILDKSVSVSAKTAEFWYPETAPLGHLTKEICSELQIFFNICLFRQIKWSTLRVKEYSAVKGWKLESPVVSFTVQISKAATHHRY